MTIDFGASSACFYPLVTEKSLEMTGELGFSNVELFMNSPSELSSEFVSQLKEIRDRYNMNIVSLHPFQSFAESFYLFSSYERRFDDSMKLYRRFFEVTSELGADIFVFHGAKTPGSVDDETYCNRFSKLIDVAAEYGVRACHENVVDYRGGTPEYLKMMREYIGDKFKIVLDIKQARRAGFSPYDFLDVLHDDVIHVHISDYNDKKSCIPPLEGNFDFVRFFKTMKEYGYSGHYIIELYEWSYRNVSQIQDSRDKLSLLVKSL